MPFSCSSLLGKWNTRIIAMCAIGSINSHYFDKIGDGKLNPIVGVYIPIVRIPIKGGMSLSKKKRDF